MVSNLFVSTAEILNIITNNSFQTTFQNLKLLKRQSCLKVDYLLFTRLIHCGRKKKDSVVCSSNHSRYLRSVFYYLIL